MDDLQWADEPSLRWLGYLVRRLEGLPVLVAAALRPPEQGFEKVLLSELVADPAARLVLPKTLSHAAVEALVRSVLSADADEAFSRACFEATGGNPLLLRALLDALASEKVPPRAEHAGAVMEIGPIAVARAVELRLARLPSEAGALAGLRQCLARMRSSESWRRSRTSTVTSPHTRQRLSPRRRSSALTPHSGLSIRWSAQRSMRS